MNTYEVIKKEGIRTIAGKLVKEGETFQASPRSATTQLLIRCKEIKIADSEPSKKSDNSLTVEEITAALKERGVEIPKGSKKPDLEKLLADSEPS